jgi:hypothetical protein
MNRNQASGKDKNLLVFQIGTVSTVSSSPQSLVPSNVVDPDPYGIFLGLQDLDPDPLIRGTDPDLDPSIIKQK